MRIAILGAALLVALVAPVAASQQSADWAEPIEPFRIADDLYYVGTAGLGAFLFPGPEGHILIDAPLEEGVPLVLASIRSLGFDPEDVRLILASHAHFDHTGGLAAMVEATGAELVLSERDAELVADGGRGDFFLGDTSPYPAVRADRTIGHLETVTVGATTLVAHLTPGHTRGCTTWSGTVTIEGEPLEFVSVCSLSVLPGYQLVGESSSYPGIDRDFCSSVAHLRELHPDIFLAPHGSFFGMKDKLARLRAGDRRAFVDPERYERYLATAAQRIDDTLTEQGEPGGCTAILQMGR